MGLFIDVSLQNKAVNDYLHESLFKACKLFKLLRWKLKIDEGIMTQVMQLYICASLPKKWETLFWRTWYIQYFECLATFGDSIYLKSIRSDKNSFYSNFVVLIQ
jgi:hypothetical protein